MTKHEFLTQLSSKLSGLPRTDIDERLMFYSEMIEDRKEDGLSEEDAVAAVGSVDEIAVQISSEIPFAKVIKDRIKTKWRLTALEIVLLVLGSPIWLSLLIAAFAVCVSLYAVLWSVIISLWSVFVSVLACGVAGIAAGILFAFTSHHLTGIVLFGAGLVCIGLSIFLFFGCKAATNGTALFTKKIALRIKRSFAEKGVRE